MTNDMNKCDDIRSQLFELNPTDSLTESMKKHLDQCAACSSVHQDLMAINQGVQLMPEHDVSDAVFDQTLQAIQAEKTPSHFRPKGINPQWASGLAASFVLVAVAGLIYNGSISEFQADFNQVPATSEVGADTKTRYNQTNKEAVSVNKPAAEEDRKRDANKAETARQAGGFTAAEPEMNETKPVSAERVVNVPLEQSIPAKPKAVSAGVLAEVLADHTARNDGLVTVEDRFEFADDEQDRRQSVGKAAVTGSRLKRSEPLPVIESAHDADKTLDQLLPHVQQVVPEAAVDYDQGAVELKKQQDPVAQFKNAELMASKAEKGDLKPSAVSTPRRGTHKDGLLANMEEGEAFASDDSMAGALGSGAPTDQSVAMKYLADLQNTAHLKFKSATGYWANSYLPGDPNMRWIQAQLKQDHGLNLPLIQQNVQPFDYPTHAALALYLNSDHQSLNESGPTRMRLQVGVQAGQQKGGHRSALNLAVVLDLGLPQKSSMYKQESMALLQALLKAKQPTDQISVYVSGGGQLIAADDFRHGPIQVALDQLFSQPQTNESDLLQTLATAHAWLKSQDDPNAVLGSSAVLLVSANQAFAQTTDLASIETRVQQNAIDGITLSTVSLAGIEHRLPLQRLALLGQGHSRVLAGAQDAQRLIDQELLVSSRAVARALRLQIKLAEGVQLIDVLDSYALSEAQAQKVRDAEQSLDQRMAKNLGIAADRGKDDDGIQIVIPSYFAGDTHVILLDVLVNRPGPVAEVSAKYKDLIYLRNATSQKSLHLSTGQNQLGPLELNVMKNVLAQHLSHTVKQASQAIRRGDQTTAVMKLQHILELYQGMRQHIPAWKSDAEMQQDESIIQQYLHLLNSQSSINPKQYQLIADSMRFMSWRKLISHSP
ncbi:hypothetical protein [Marinicella litoralis]|uniref:Uncharacterized protein n=1 Tax=Marinicella litoralis TaxID=644220 RepID=A0A4R6XR68_9GAMM|nr:hypothetical protein [Marinicella litoralis]TDR20484.1 hypothetical protein C8D91_1458 [Marinicella litoralis]